MAREKKNNMCLYGRVWCGILLVFSVGWCVREMKKQNLYLLSLPFHIGYSIYAAQDKNGMERFVRRIFRFSQIFMRTSMRIICGCKATIAHFSFRFFTFSFTFCYTFPLFFRFVFGSKLLLLYSVFFFTWKMEMEWRVRNLSKSNQTFQELCICNPLINSEIFAHCCRKRAELLFSLRLK